jgi:hypothetical protein
MALINYLEPAAVNLQILLVLTRDSILGRGKFGSPGGSASTEILNPQFTHAAVSTPVCNSIESEWLHNGTSPSSRDNQTRVLGKWIIDDANILPFGHSRVRYQTRSDSIIPRVWSMPIRKPVTSFRRSLIPEMQSCQYISVILKALELEFQLGPQEVRVYQMVLRRKTSPWDRCDLPEGKFVRRAWRGVPLLVRSPD